MATKTITITEDAYNSIKGIKSEHESFSHLFIRLAKDKSVAEKYFGLLKGSSTITSSLIKEIREETSKDFKKRENVLSRHIRHN